MVLNVSFSEIKETIREKTGKTPEILYVDNKTVKVGYMVAVKVPFLGKISKMIEVNITVDGFIGEELWLSYDAGIGVNMIVNGLFRMLPLANELVELSESSKAVIHLDKIEKVHEVLQHIEVHEIRFDADGMNVDFAANF